MKKLTLILLGSIFLMITGCSDHGHNEQEPIKHDKLN
jgi:K+ transporter